MWSQSSAADLDCQRGVVSGAGALITYPWQGGMAYFGMPWRFFFLAQAFMLSVTVCIHLAIGIVNV